MYSQFSLRIEKLLPRNSWTALRVRDRNLIWTWEISFPELRSSSRSLPTASFSFSSSSSSPPKYEDGARNTPTRLKFRRSPRRFSPISHPSTITSAKILSIPGQLFFHILMTHDWMRLARGRVFSTDSRILIKWYLILKPHQEWEGKGRVSKQLVKY